MNKKYLISRQSVQMENPVKNKETEGDGRGSMLDVAQVLAEFPADFFPEVRKDDPPQKRVDCDDE